MSVNLKQRAYEHIRQNLLSGRYQPGSALSAISLAKEIGISQTPVREAISQLETEGLVEQIPRLGMRVKVIDRRELEELFEIRELLESGAAARAAERINGAGVHQLEELCRQFQALAHQFRDIATQKGDFEATAERLVVNDVAFHLTIFTAADNRRMRKIVADLHLMSHLFRRQWDTPAVSVVSRLAWTLRDHWRITLAIKRRDAAAASQWMARHMRRAKRYLLGVYDWAQRADSRPGVDSAWPEHVQRLIQEMAETKLEQASPVRGSGPPSAAG
jgi:DNA-binding GntR family transcriptional regulator